MPKKRLSKKTIPSRKTVAVAKRTQARAKPTPRKRAVRKVVAAKAERKHFRSPDEVRTFEKGTVELLNIGGGAVGRLTLEPGWRWSQHVKPIAGTNLCEAPHFQYQVSGQLHVVMADGTEFETGPGEVSALPSGHDAWVVGDNTVVLIDWSGASNYAKK